MPSVEMSRRNVMKSGGVAAGALSTAALAAGAGAQEADGRRRV